MSTASVVTVLFTDIVGSTRDLDRLGEEVAVRLHMAHIAQMRELVTEHDGRVVKSMGDGLMCVFTSALQATRCAVSMQRALAENGSDLQIRVGLDCGEPIEQDDDYFGNPVIVAKRLCDLAEPGQVLASSVTIAVAGKRLGEIGVAPVGPVAVRGLGDPVEVFKVLWNEDQLVPEPRGISVVIVDDQRLLRVGFSVILDSEKDIHVVGEAGDGLEAIEAVRTFEPDVVVMDVRMPNLDGLEAARIIVRDWPSTKVLMLTTFDVDEYVFDAIRAGASGFLLKDVPAEQLISAVRCIASGESLIDPAVTQRMVMRFAQPPSEKAASEIASLTPRESEILRLIARGLSNAEIGAELFVEESTVKTHVGKVLQKLGLRDRVQAVVFAYESGFLESQ